MTQADTVHTSNNANAQPCTQAMPTTQCDSAATPKCKHNTSTTQATHWKHATTQTGDLESVTGDLESVTDGPL